MIPALLPCQKGTISWNYSSDMKPRTIHSITLLCNPLSSLFSPNLLSQNPILAVTLNTKNMCLPYNFNHCKNLNISVNSNFQCRLSLRVDIKLSLRFPILRFTPNQSCLFTILIFLSSSNTSLRHSSIRMQVTAPTTTRMIAQRSCVTSLKLYRNRFLRLV